MNTNEALIELTEHEQAAITGGGDIASTAAGAAGAAGTVEGGTAVSAVISQWADMAAAGYSMTTGEAAYVAVNAAIAPETIVAAGVAVDAYLVGQAAQEGYGAYQAISTLASQYESQGQSTVSAWASAIWDGLSGLWGE